MINCSYFREIKASTSPHIVSSEIVSTGCRGTNSAIIFLEHIEVQMTFRYSFRGAVQITLESPTGTTSRLLTRRHYDKKANSKQQWTFMSVQHWGEDPTGTWRLNMSLIQDQKETGSNMFIYVTVYLCFGVTFLSTIWTIGILTSIMGT